MRNTLSLPKSLLFLVAFSSFIYAAEALHIVGSSTVYPFSSAIAEELGATTKHKTPLVESTGSGGGFKLFCAGTGKNTPDITNASRRMKKKELAMCAKNGAKDITEAIIGYDGIVVAQTKTNKDFSLTRKHLFLALAAKVPNNANNKLVDNPYTKWNQIDASLPNKKIRVYGPPTSSGTRDAFEELAMQSISKKMDIYKKSNFKKYSKIREDGVYIPSGENDNLIVQKLVKDTTAVGIFGYSFLQENAHKIKSISVEKKDPTMSNISSGDYPISRSLFFYIKNAKSSQAQDGYVKLFMSDSMIGEDGYLSELGLIPLEESTRAKVRKRVLANTKLTTSDL